MLQESVARVGVAKRNNWSIPFSNETKFAVGVLMFEGMRQHGLAVVTLF